ncbi:MAG TPA: GNAT family N-acetyltransferase [Acidimicrobiia bacterium]
MTITVRPLVDAEIEEFRSCLVRGFGDDPQGSAEEFREWFAALVPLVRSRVAFDDGRIVGTLATYSQQVSTPGASAPMAGTSMVTVLPTHRRRGVLRSMMTAHLVEAREHGDAVAGLWASESSIYGRFGYGVAAWRQETELATSAAAFVDGDLPGDVAFVDAAVAYDVIAPVYERVRGERPGMLERSELWWQHRVLADKEHVRGGASSLRVAVHRVDGVAEGYVLYRQKQRWADFPEGEVRVVELAAATPRAHGALWRLVANVDLYPKVSAWNTPVDDELAWRVAEPRRVLRRTFDSLWLRVLDVEAALTSRAYLVEAAVTVAVRDPLIDEIGGTFRLEAGPDGAECRRVSGDADLHVEIDALASLLLGGAGARELARAGRIRGTHEAIRQATAVFGWDMAPWCPEIF